LNYHKFGSRINQQKVEIKQAQIKSLLFYLGEVVISFVDFQSGAL
jgi:hypothetical protein